MLDGFDLANDRPAESSHLAEALRKALPEDQAYFIAALAQRLADRLELIFYIRGMANPYAIITGEAEIIDDEQRVQRLLAEFHQARQPLFVHIHFLGTHGARYTPKRRVFSAGKNDIPPWDQDSYDDSILEFDATVGVIIDALIRDNLFDQTLLIVGSDHGSKFSALSRLPLIIHFPGERENLSELAGRRIASNVQNLDLAPTILAVLGLEKPGWMAGNSLLQAELPQRPIFSFNTAMDETEHTAAGWVDIKAEKFRPPFYQFQAINVVYCDRWYSLDLNAVRWNYGKVSGHTAPCALTDLPNHAIVFGWMLEHLRIYGFDISSLEDFTPIYEHEDIR